MQWRAGLPAAKPLAVLEVPLLFETGMEELFDATVAIVAADEVRAERAGARGTCELEARAARQLSQDEKAARATYVRRERRLDRGARGCALRDVDAIAPSRDTREPNAAAGRHGRGRPESRRADR